MSLSARTRRRLRSLLGPAGADELAAAGADGAALTDWTTYSDPDQYVPLPAEHQPPLSFGRGLEITPYDGQGNVVGFDDEGVVARDVGMRERTAQATVNASTEEGFVALTSQVVWQWNGSVFADVYPTHRRTMFWLTAGGPRTIRVSYVPDLPGELAGEVLMGSGVVIDGALGSGTARGLVTKLGTSDYALFGWESTNTAADVALVADTAPNRFWEPTILLQATAFFEADDYGFVIPADNAGVYVLDLWMTPAWRIP